MGASRILIRLWTTDVHCPVLVGGLVDIVRFRCAVDNLNEAKERKMVHGYLEGQEYLLQLFYLKRIYHMQFKV